MQSAQPAFLIADDSQSKMDFLKEVFYSSGWAVILITAVTTEDAEILIQKSGSIVGAFIDYYIPSRNGPKIISTLRKKFPHCPIALVSSARSAKNTKEALEAGAERAVCTSDPEDTVRAELLSLLDLWEQRSER